MPHGEEWDYAMPKRCLYHLLSLHLTVALAACGDSVGGEMGDSGRGGDDSASLVASGLVGSWQRFASSTVVTLSRDGTYKLDEWAESSPGLSGLDREQSETGTYSVSGSTVTFTPKESSCKGPDPARVDTFVVVSETGIAPGAGFELTDPNMGGNWIQYTGAITPASTAMLGCLSSPGTFTPSPLAPVSP
jgi:hypothetical protein